MRPVGDHPLMRYQAKRMVAAEPTGISHSYVGNLLVLADDDSRVIILSSWDRSAGGGVYGGSRRVSLVPAPFIAA
ncbi:hypothetical protein ACIA48_29325 [Mycobacterium sp. NPDC051804]|uniref:hypothetical protein n=1 Tax=Mycobacterium sp. NPDC051804 TaxID=3364295 RepID=UPI0037B1CC21